MAAEPETQISVRYRLEPIDPEHGELTIGPYELRGLSQHQIRDALQTIIRQYVQIKITFQDGDLQSIHQLSQGMKS